MADWEKNEKKVAQAAARKLIHKEVTEVLLKAGKPELAQAYARQVKAADAPNAGDRAWDAIESSWSKNSRPFIRDMLKEAKVLGKPGFMQGKDPQTPGRNRRSH